MKKILNHIDTASSNTNLPTLFHFNDVVDRLIRDTEGASLLGCSKATWWRRVSDGTLPPAIKICGISRWKLSDVLQVIEKLRVAQSAGDHSNSSLRM